MQHWDSKSRPLGHESPPTTTRPGLPVVTKLVERSLSTQVFTVNSFEKNKSKNKEGH